MIIPVENINSNSLYTNFNLDFTSEDQVEILCYCPTINNYFYINAVWFKDRQSLVIAYTENEKQVFCIPYDKLKETIEKWYYIKRDNDNSIINLDEILKNYYKDYYVI